MVPLTTSPNYEATAGALARGVATCGKPGFVIVTPGSVATEVRRVIRAEGVPVCDRIDDGLRMLRAYRDFQPTVGSMAPVKPEPAKPVAAPRSGYLGEPEAKVLLAQVGIRTAREKVVATRREAAEAADAIGYPVVLKGVSTRIVHKSDAGLVKVGLAGRAQVEAAYDAVTGALQRVDPAAKHCLVAEMVAGEAELILGARLDPQFGPVVMVGAGGVLVELLEDTQLALAPVDAATAEAMLRRLRVFRLLQGYRGKPPLDVAAVIDALVRLGALAHALGERLTELDINPLIVRRAGQGAVAVDARAVIA
jgi:acetyl-CoA synthetase (ADP-forming)